MNGRNAPLSPVSLGGSEWSVGKYQPINEDPYANNRGNIASPPNSGGSNGAMNGSFPPGPRSAGGPSPPPSVGRSSNGTNLYARSESGRSIREEQAEGILGEHYVALKNFLNGGQGGRPTPPNKARDKLLRLSPVQFLELSTDVYDELIRRQSLGRRPSGPGAQNPPPYLLPEPNFHPKRNQARQKLSSLGPPRFRDLATDVFCELERRFPRFAAGDIPRVGSPVSVRSQATVNGSQNGYPPRSQSRMRRPSDASSMRGPPPSDPYGVPPSPGMPPNGEYNRPMQKQFQSNTIVPNKSTMVEEDDDGSPNEDDGEAFGLERTATNRTSKRSQATEQSAVASEADKKLLDEYQSQVRELREKLDAMEDVMKKKDDEMNSILDSERSRSTAANMEKKEFADLRLNLENKLAEAQDLNDSLKQELDRMRDDHASESRQLRDQVEELRQSSMAAANVSNGNADRELQRENEQLRRSLQEQQQVTEEARREAREFLREMKLLSQQSGSTWQKQEELEKTIEQLESEVREWRNRYARTKTQLRDMRASSLGLTVEQDAGKYVRERGFTQDNGAVKDVHVTKFQIAIDELLQRARSDDPDKVVDAMKQVVVSVRRITKDIDEAAQTNEDLMQQRSKLKGKISSSANNLITSSKNYAASAGISPVSLLDAAASHLVAAIVDLLRTVKIRTTPAGELEDDDDGTITPVDSTGFFSPRTASRQESIIQDTVPVPLPLGQAPPFQGLGGRTSMDSSAYSPINSPRQSADTYNRGPNGPNGMNGMNGMGYNMGMNKTGPSNGFGMRRDNQTEELKIYLEDQTAILVQNIQNLVGSIRSDASINQITSEINGINEVVGKVISETEASGNGDMIGRLAACRERLLEASERGMEIDRNQGAGAGNDREWRMWTQTLPPIAFEIARETKELVQRVDQMVLGNGNSGFA
ncbi:cell polarity protein [Colletotrichum truncatum]|uniref:Cell polarity protein n=1 Tax=Colletotrichum truncatum TaxID=5467 RepID=A0ACC3YT14_COLTU|nr:cell polarity protein [Colletotrichum truncatum]KAF6785087.1 cell polarity protein [Colletotrichum truncatum]